MLGASVLLLTSEMWLRQAVAPSKPRFLCTKQSSVVAQEMFSGIRPADEFSLGGSVQPGNERDSMLIKASICRITMT